MERELLNHKFIVFCQDHYNPLGIIRSLGEKGIRTTVILESEHPVMINHCRHVEKLHLVKTKEEGLQILMNLYCDEPEKPFLYTASDDITSLLDLHYDELIDKFYFFHGGEQGVVTHYMDKAWLKYSVRACGKMMIPTVNYQEAFFPSFPWENQAASWAASRTLCPSGSVPSVQRMTWAPWIFWVCSQ